MSKKNQNSKQEQTLQVSPASPLVRLAAFAYDGLLMLAMWFVLGGIAVAVNGGEGLAPNNPFMPALMFVIWFWFNAHFWRRGGQTLGMRAWRLRLLTTDQGPLTLLQCGLRLVAAVPSFALLGLGYWWGWIDKNGRTWHDIYSHTRVIREPKV